jgi:hypothetical protein
MLEYAGRLAQQDGVSVDVVSGDIRQPCLPVGAAGNCIKCRYLDCRHENDQDTRVQSSFVMLICLNPWFLCRQAQEST